MEEILFASVVVSKCMNISIIGTIGHDCLFRKNISKGDRQ